jgi:hypothetical protein
MQRSNKRRQSFAKVYGELGEEVRVNSVDKREIHKAIHRASSYHRAPDPRCRMCSRR